MPHDDFDAILGEIDEIIGGPHNTGRTSISGRPIFKDEMGQDYSEKTVTFPLKNKWYTFPSVDAQGNIQDEDTIRNYLLEYGPVDPITKETFPSFGSLSEAIEYAKKRSRTR